MIYLAVIKLTNVLSEEDLSYLINEINNASGENLQEDNILGRMQAHYVIVNDSIWNKMTEIVNSISDTPLVTTNSPLCVTYSNKYGQPNLPPHYDADHNDMIVDFQVSSNTSWDIGVGTSMYSMEDNSAIVFNPNAQPHWRPIKTFNDNEYITMAFFRFYNPENKSDYSHLKFSSDDSVFEEINHLRNNVNNI